MVSEKKVGSGDGVKEPSNKVVVKSTTKVLYILSREIIK